MFKKWRLKTSKQCQHITDIMNYKIEQKTQEKSLLTTTEFEKDHSYCHIVYESLFCGEFLRNWYELIVKNLTDFN